MGFLGDAGKALERNGRWLLLYAALAAAVGLISTGWGVALHALVPGGGSEAPFVLKFADLSVTLLTIAVFAVMRCVVFTKIGRQMDHPLWNIMDWREGVRRFFWMWLAIDLVTLGLGRIGGGLLYLPLAIISVPVGACLMFHRHVGSAGEAAEALKPLGNLLGKTLIVLLLNGSQFIIFAFMVDPQPNPLSVALASSAIVHAAANAVECAAFAATWLVCIEDRDTMEEDGFDF